ncbi:MAG: VOC family protein [Pseudomonadales bacterium]
MLSDASIVAFVAVSDGMRAKAFYQGLLGLTLLDEDTQSLMLLSHGTTLRVQILPTVQPPPYTVLGWTVPDIVSRVRRLAERGVQFERFSGMDQDELGIWRTPHRALVAWFRDPDGNLLSLTELPSA